jgi:hypothetical protein
MSGVAVAARVLEQARTSESSSCSKPLYHWLIETRNAGVCKKDAFASIAWSVVMAGKAGVIRSGVRVIPNRDAPNWCYQM